MIAFDARKLFDGGIGTYIRGVLDGIGALEPALAVTALVDPADAGRRPWPGAVRERPVRAGKYGLDEHWRVPAAARAVGAQLLHAPHYTLPLGWAGPSLVTIHDLIHLRFPRFFPPGAALYARAMAGMAAQRARVVLADSEFGRREVIELLGVPETRVRAVTLGVSPAFTRAAGADVAAFLAERGLPAGYVLYVGARRRHKNLTLLLQAWRTLPAHARPPLVLSGARWNADEPLAREAAALGVAEQVHFAGDPRDDASLRLLYSGAALYVQPSLCEGFGLPPLEAMACGTPVLSSNAGSLPEVLGDAAELLPPHSPEAWAAAVTSLLGDTPRLAALAARGPARAGMFRWEHTARQTRQAWEDALEA